MDHRRARNVVAAAHHRLAARNRAAVQNVARGQSGRRGSGVRQGRPVVGLAVGCRRHRHRQRIHRQRAVRVRHTIITRHIIIAVHDYDCAGHNRILISGSIRLAARQRDAGDLVASTETGHRHVVTDIRGIHAGRSLSGTVVCVGLRIGRNRHQRLHRHFARANTVAAVLKGDSHRVGVGAGFRCGRDLIGI